MWSYIVRRVLLGNTFLLAIAAACLGFTLGVGLGTTAAFHHLDGL